MVREVFAEDQHDSVVVSSEVVEEHRVCGAAIVFGLDGSLLGDSAEEVGSARQLEKLHAFLDRTLFSSPICMYIAKELGELPSLKHEFPQSFVADLS